MLKDFSMELKSIFEQYKMERIKLLLFCDKIREVPGTSLEARYL